ncbi:MAG: depupylase/deamidase Dop [Bowdeniella nasicola]|nr:depupylase/deamidase Dop [Bowdeniella nasicola]
MIRPLGLETEYGITESGVSSDVIELSTALVEAYASSVPHAGWDYRGEDPLADARGYRLPRAAADPSMLTDNPDRAAPSGPAQGSVKGHGTRAKVGAHVMDYDGDTGRRGAANAVLTNGARLYVDHAHPEYSGPEVTTPLDAVRWDRAGDEIATRAVDILAARGRTIAVYKNNGDGKGASYGTHENYLVDRHLPFGDIVQHLTTFLVTRPLICGSGRVGIGQRSEESGFQISQRADYIENDIGLQTTFDRPIINTRDEPHADARRWRRLHVITGDATLFDVSTFLKVGVTSLVLWYLERGEVALDLDALTLSAPVVDCWGVSHDPFGHHLSATTGSPTALDIQRTFCDLIGNALESDGVTCAQTAQVMKEWSRILDGLATDPASLVTDVEWIAKKTLLESMRRRGNLSWDDPKLQAADLQWAQLGPRGLVSALDRAGRVRRLVAPAEVEAAVTTPPADTRAYLRGLMISRFPVHTASWSSLVTPHPDRTGYMRISLPDPTAGTQADLGTLAEAEYAEIIAALKE